MTFNINFSKDKYYKYFMIKKFIKNIKQDSIISFIDFFNAKNFLFWYQEIKIKTRTPEQQVELKSSMVAGANKL